MAVPGLIKNRYQPDEVIGHDLSDQEESRIQAIKSHDIFADLQRIDAEDDVKSALLSLSRQLIPALQGICYRWGAAEGDDGEVELMVFAAESHRSAEFAVGSGYVRTTLVSNSEVKRYAAARRPYTLDPTVAWLKGD